MLLNRSSIPLQRAQVQPGPLVTAGSADIEDLQSQIDELEMQKANASTVGGLSTALNAAVARIDALEAANVSILARLDALEAP